MIPCENTRASILAFFCASGTGGRQWSWWSSDSILSLPAATPRQTGWAVVSKSVRTWPWRGSGIWQLSMRLMAWTSRLARSLGQLPQTKKHRHPSKTLHNHPVLSRWLSWFRSTKDTCKNAAGTGKRLILPQRRERFFKHWGLTSPSWSHLWWNSLKKNPELLHPRAQKFSAQKALKGMESRTKRAVLLACLWRWGAQAQYQLWQRSHWFATRAFRYEMLGPSYLDCKSVDEAWLKQIHTPNPIQDLQVEKGRIPDNQKC